MILFLSIIFCFVEWTASCEVKAWTTTGWVCGLRRYTDDGAEYASFRGIPYAKQPLGKLRFEELHPHKKWHGYYDATVEGPACPGHDVFFGPLMQPHGISEACIYTNVHVPIDSLPRPTRPVVTTGLPILIYIHGGAWVTGSGDTDVNGPENLVGKGVIVITFNYRLDVFGFLSLNTTKIPGNNGLRDMITLLRWVQANARYFGGNPDDVTLSGQSAGATSTHLLSLSPAAEGLFHRAWLMSGTAMHGYYSTEPENSKRVAETYLAILGIKTTDKDKIHDQLVKIPLERLFNASKILLNQSGITAFVPVVESPLPHVTRILTDDPINLINSGVGNKIPLVIGFTNSECETIRPRLEELISLITPLLTVPFQVVYTVTKNPSVPAAVKLLLRYFSTGISVDNIIKLCSEAYFQYPAIRAARARVATGGAPVYLYKFSYQAVQSSFKRAFNLTYTGAGHAEDLNRILKVNSLPSRNTSDKKMNEWMSNFMFNYMLYSDPAFFSSSDSWPPLTNYHLEYQHVITPFQFIYKPISNYDREMVNFFDRLNDVQE